MNRRRLVPALVFVAVCGAVFAPVLSGRRTMYPTDITNRLFLPFASHASEHVVQETATIDYILQYYPSRVFQAHSLREGTLGLWNPAQFGGHPAFASNGSQTMLDPFNLLLALVPDVGTALAWRAFLQVLACMLAMYAYLRHLSLRSTASQIGAIGFGLNSMFWVNIFDWSPSGLLWAPIVCIVLDRALAELSVRRAGVAGLVIGLAFLASPLQIALYVATIGGGGAVLRWVVFADPGAPRMRRVLLIAGALAAGMMVSAIQALPTAELLLHSTRLESGAMQASAKHLRSLREMVLATAGLIAFPFPNLAGRLKDAVMVSGALWGGESHWQGFIGLMPFTSGAVAVIATRTRIRWTFITLALAAIVIVVYTPLMLLVYERFFLVYIFAASVLAAMGAEALMAGTVDRARLRWVLRGAITLLVLVATVAIAATLAMGLAGDRVRAAVTAAVRPGLATNFLGQAYPNLYLAKADQFVRDLCLDSPHALVPLAIFAGCLLLLAAFARGRLTSRAFGNAAVLVTALDMVFMAVTHVPFISRATDPFEPKSPAIDLIRAANPQARVLSFTSPGQAPVLPLATSSVYGLASASGYDNLWPSNLSTFVRPQLRSCDTGQCLDLAGSAISGIGYVMTDPTVDLPSPRFARVYDREVRVYRDSWALPRIYATTSWSAEADTARAITRARAVDVRSDLKVILDRPPGIPSVPTATPMVVSLDLDTPTSIAATVQLSNPAIVVLSDTYYPNWVCHVDNAPAPVLRANGIMRAVVVQAGRHRIAFEYRPASFIRGAWLSGSTAVALACLAFRVRRRGPGAR